MVSCCAGAIEHAPVNATLAGGVTVATGGALGGTGTILGAVLTTGTGVIDPGDVLGTSTSQLTTGNLELGSSGTFTAQASGTVAGSGHDQLTVTGSVTLGGTLDLSRIAGFSSVNGDIITLIENDGEDAIVGTFDGIDEGDSLSAGGERWIVSYVGGTGNDVTATRFGAIFDVTNLSLSGDGSLYQAIIDANATEGSDMIRILATGVLPITSGSSLPEITDVV